MTIPLEPQETELKRQVEECVNQIRLFIENPSSATGDFKEVEDRMGDLAHKLHMSLKKRGLEPKHHKYMIRNRGLNPDAPDFYKHIHPTEDLMKFLEDPHANDDPEDQTIGETFEFRAYSRRWGHEDTYKLTRTADGWFFQWMSSGNCDKGAWPYLFKALEHDTVIYPEGLDGFFEWLWKQANEKGLSKEQVQNAINQLAEWVSQTEKSAPCKGVWEGYC